MSKLLVKFKKISFLIVILFFMLMLILFPDRYITSCINGLKLWALTVLPSLLPFFFLTSLLTQTGTLVSLSKKITPLTKFLFNQKGISAYAFIMSILSGYPVGSRIICDLYSQNIISKGEAERLSVLATTSGPLFIIGAVGIGMFNDKIIGFIIYLAHVLSAILVGIIFRNHGKSLSLDNAFSIKESDNNVLYNCVYNSVISSLIVGGFVSVFYVFAEVISDFNILFPIELLLQKPLSLFGGDISTSKAYVIGFIECTKGCKELSSIAINPLNISLSASLISFGGISIILQSLTFLKKAKVSALFFLKGKILQTLFTLVIVYVSLLIFL